MREGGDCLPTPRRLVLEVTGGESIARLRPEQVLHPDPGVDHEALMQKPGDGSVTRSSVLAHQRMDPSVPRHEYSSEDLGRAFFICERHDALTGNVGLIDNLLLYLLEDD
jgi:hypothetical protein